MPAPSIFRNYPRLSASGVIRVDVKERRMVLEPSPDLIGLYQWFIQRRYWVDLQLPKFSAHVTICNKKFHPNVDWELAALFDGTKLKFEYDPYLVMGGGKKGFLMFYLKVFSLDIDAIKSKVGAVEGENYKGLHLSVSNSKSNTAKKWWPKMIEIKE